LRDLLLQHSSDATAKLESITRLNFALAREYADAVRYACEASSIAMEDVDLIGSHGQTICHLPETDGALPAATLQIGDPSVLANLTRTAVVGDFRVADMALGGQGAPLVPYFDYLMFGDSEKARVAVNIGGIANITVLPPAAQLDDVVAFDTGPGNMVMDSLAKRLLGKSYDDRGQAGANGTADDTTVSTLLEAPYFHRKPPKSTGREDYGDHYSARLLEIAAQNGVTSPEDLMATAAELTARSIRLSCEHLINNGTDLGLVVVGGGGTRNDHLMSVLEQAFAPVPVVTTAHFGIDPDAKEAICFAVLANETIDGRPSNVPAATGSSRTTILGKICLPSG
jgi:anhydro-N-acetylmuramic acid kinase